ncbi:MAG: hypothetical protein KDA96_20720, partial [Planctomycetaceae bacterium]|nr:hypothetical protein [Planctomycetaceae bacterium]
MDHEVTISRGDRFPEFNAPDLLPPIGEQHATAQDSFDDRPIRDFDGEYERSLRVWITRVVNL